MRKTLQTLALSALLLVPASAAHAQVSFGIRIGEPPAPRAYRVPRQPGPDYVWVEGYWYPQGSRYHWHEGYWTRPPYEGAYWVEPYYVGGRYFPGRWESRRGTLAHDHRWDRSRQRDDRRDLRGDRRDYRGDDRNDGRR
jgi:WXXGXW repeat (2 copies)